MTEISKPYKIMLIINIVIALAYAIPYMFFINTWAGLIEYTYSTPWYAQVFGLVLFMIAAWLLRAILQKKTFESLSYFLEFIFVVLFGMIIYFALELLFVPLTPIALIYAWVSLGVTIALFISNMVFYFVETARSK
jgi:hypothetical protein